MPTSELLKSAFGLPEGEIDNEKTRQYSGNTLLGCMMGYAE
jgi:hypothetical protein